MIWSEFNGSAPNGVYISVTQPTYYATFSPYASDYRSDLAPASKLPP